jgi:hypothetical protein
MDNQTAPQDNGQAQAGVQGLAPAPVMPQGMPNEGQPSFSWKGTLGNDLANAPMFKKFDDTKDGLVNAFKSHAELEKMLGHEKVPIPKDDKDEVGWSRLNKALGVPDTATQYGLKDINIPDAIKGSVMNKDQFAELVHGFKLTPRQASGLWEAYNNKNVETYSKYVQESEKAITGTINSLKAEWGDAFDSNVQLGQMVINKFAPNAEAKEWIINNMVKHPHGAKFLADIGKQFSENKIGDFKYQSFSLAPDQAKDEIAKIMADPKHPYLNEKATVQERNEAIDYVNSLHAIVAKGKQG